MTEIRVPLKFGCVGVVVSDDVDRGPYVPPPVSMYEPHHERCGCPKCVAARRTGLVRT